MQSVTITKADDGSFTVSAAPQPGAMPDTDGDNDAGQSSAGQPAPDLKSALLLAARMLSQPDAGAQQSPFDQGLQKTMPNKAPPFQPGA